MSNLVQETLVRSHTINESQVNDKLLCSVCHEDFRISESVSKLVCDHVFHQSCILPWLVRKSTCPVCRRVLLESVVSDADDEEEEDEEEYGEEEEEEIIDVGVDQGMMVINNSTNNSLMTVSVQYHSQVDQQSRRLTRSPEISIQPINDSDDDSEVVLDFTGSNSPSISLSNSNMEDLNTSYDYPSDLDLSDYDPNDIFVEFENSYDTDTNQSDTSVTDFMDTLDSDGLDVSIFSNYFDVTLETSMDFDEDYF